LKAHSYQNVKSILAPGMDRQPLPQLVAPRPPLEHENIRGAAYERFVPLVDHHWNWRENQAMLRRLKKSKLNPEPCGEDIHYRYPRQIDPALIRSLTSSQWVLQQLCLLFTGPTGIGKS
jgi:DNA replication protein DnaC